MLRDLSLSAVVAGVVAVGAFLLCGLLITLAGATGWFKRVMDRIPQALAAALPVGVLTRFAIHASRRCTATSRSWPRCSAPT